MTDAEIAPPTARALAVFVDYLLINAIISLTSHVVGSADDGIILAMVLSALYYIIGNSSLIGGATLGKRAFGLRVYSTRLPRASLLPVGASLVRYFACFGAILLLAEVPERIFRSYAVTGSPYLLESPMLLALAYTIANACCVLLNPTRRGFHDLLSGSIVLRGNSAAVADSARLLARARNSVVPRLLQSPLASALLGIVIGGVLWLSGLTHPKLVSQISANRFYIEHEFPVRIISLGNRPQTLEIDLLDVQEPAMRQQPMLLLEQLGRFLIDTQIISADEVAQVAFSLYTEIAVESTIESPTVPTKPVDKTAEEINNNMREADVVSEKSQNTKAGTVTILFDTKSKTVSLAPTSELARRAPASNETKPVTDSAVKGLSETNSDGAIVK